MWKIYKFNICLLLKIRMKNYTYDKEKEWNETECGHHVTTKIFLGFL